MPPLRTALILISFGALHGAGARTYEVPPDDVAGFFANLPKDATRVTFTGADVYRCSFDIVLPDRQLLVIDGAGARLVLGPNSNGFTRRIADQQDAMKRVSSRYVIRDFAAIEGGLKGIDLCATLGSTVSNVRLVGQAQTALELRFCLMCRLEMVLVTNPRRAGILVRHGDWSGANTSNSQSNSTVLEQCRVFSTATTTKAFEVLNSGGVHMVDCISEGGSPEYDLYLSAVTSGGTDRTANNPVVKSFTLANFHVEHRVRKASIHVNMPHQSTASLSNIYWNVAQEMAVIEYVSGQLTLSDIGWFKPDFRIHTRVNAPRITVERCHSALRIPDKVEASGTRAGVLELVDPLPGHGVLKLDHVHLSRPSR